MKTIKGTELAGKELEVLEDGTLRLIENKSKRFIPSIGEEYWYVEYGQVVFAQNEGAYSDNWIINHQLIFKTEEKCFEYKEFLELLDEYKCDFDWTDYEQYKYFLIYKNEVDKLITGNRNISKIQGTFYFKSEEDAQEFIEKAGKENIKRFMFDIWE